MAPGGDNPPHAHSKPAALSTELRGLRSSLPRRAELSLSTLAVAVAQLVEPRVVVPVVAGSSPVRHPSWLRSTLCDRGPVAQRIEQRTSNPCAEVRLLPGPSITCQSQSIPEIPRTQVLSARPGAD